MDSDLFVCRLLSCLCGESCMRKIHRHRINTSRRLVALMLNYVYKQFYLFICLKSRGKGTVVIVLNQIKNSNQPPLSRCVGFSSCVVCFLLKTELAFWGFIISIKALICMHTSESQQQEYHLVS